MAADLVIAPEAVQDIDAAYGWYEGRMFGLGEEFLSSVEACIQAICRLPEIYTKVHKEYRRALVRRFPCAVFYEYVTGTVTVYCVFHTSRSPDRLRERLS
ncbi:MAG: type II toxin-antitoxin system RelE/ParE family toxin [Planctomycetota bacterium]|nr:type II toxin-antitoxin system RelE/ParE family toxin [Planctomycetota bacterium]